MFLHRGLILFVAAWLGWGALPHAIAERGDADVLVARGILAYDEKRYEDALELLDQALALESKDPRALLYKGLVFLSQYRPERAVEPLEKAYELRQDDLHIRYHLGVAYFKTGQYDKAGPLLEALFDQQPGMDNLGFYVGFLRYREGQEKEAIEAFDANTSKDPTIRQRNKELKAIALGLGGGLETFSVVEAEPFTRPLSRFQDVLAGGRPITEEKKRWRLLISLGGYYDDNVPINPDSVGSIPIRNPPADPNETISDLRDRDKTAPGFLANVRGDYVFYREGKFESMATYSFLQTVNGDGLSDWNIQNHLGGLSAFYRGLVGKYPYQLAAQYTYDYYFLDMDAFLGSHKPRLTASLVGPVWASGFLGVVGNLTTVTYQYTVNNFFNQPTNDPRFAGNDRDGFNNMIGLDHAFRFANDRALIHIGYQYDNDSTDGVAFSYSGNKLLTGGQVTLPWGLPWGPITMRYDYEVHWRAYKNSQVTPEFTDRNGFLVQRYDIQQNHLFQITQPLPDDFFISFQYQGIRNSSHVPVYDYEKNMFLSMVTKVF
jgi:tetratricopeptide (TPR) repeat protein